MVNDQQINHSFEVNTVFYTPTLQHAVNHMKVAFMPPVEDIGPEPLLLQFVFSVSDQQGGTISGLLFNITVIPVDDQAPEVRVKPRNCTDQIE